MKKYYIVKTKHPKESRYYAVTRGSGEGGGIKRFESKQSAQRYAKQLISFKTKIYESVTRTRKAPQPRQPRGFGFTWERR